MVIKRTNSYDVRHRETIRFALSQRPGQSQWPRGREPGFWIDELFTAYQTRPVATASIAYNFAGTRALYTQRIPGDLLA